MIKQLDLATLCKLDEGRIEAAMNLELSHIVLDLMNRPGDKRERKLTLTMICKPICDDTGECESVDVQFTVKHALPSKKSKVYDMRARKSARGAMLVFSEHAPDNHDQITIFDEE